MAARIMLYVVASWLIAAHFLRTGNLLLTTLCLLTPLLFCVRRRWSVLLLQWLAYLAAIIWLGTAWQIVAVRWSLGQNWRLAAAILGTVAAVSVLAGLVLRGAALQARYPVDE